MTANPFGVYNPEQLDADYIAKNFVDVYTDLPRLRDEGNTFILGARGTGKSMLLRSLEPEVMIKAKKALSIAELPYLAVHVPLKKAEFAIPELSRLAGYAGTAIGEHLLVMHSMFRLTGLLSSLSQNIAIESAIGFSARFYELLSLSEGGQNADDAVHEEQLPGRVLNQLQRSCEREIIRVRQYFTRMSFASEPPEYTGALTGFLDFLVPLVEYLRTIDGIPNVPVFLMLDDADNLPQNMQRVLNSWVSTRSTHAVCLKITTQLGYATLRTVDDRIIESPHDFAEVNLGTVYTANQERYSNRIREIVARRLALAQIDATPENFFPYDATQAARLGEIEAEIRSEWEQKRLDPAAPDEGSSRVRDEVTRYATPRLMRELAGSSKSSHTYSYAGFASLVDLSSGVVRWFLEPASRMYDRASDSGLPPSAIPVGIQDEIISDWSREFVGRLTISDPTQTPSDDDISNDGDRSLHAFGHETVLYDRVKNLLDGLGRLFRERLLTSDASEQRVFSVVVRGTIPEDLRQVLGLAVRLGYLQMSDNAAKEPLGGRLPRVVLSRRLGPYYRLDVSGYAAHLSVVGQDLAKAMFNPADFVASRLKFRDDRQYALDLERLETDGSSDKQ